MTPADDEVEALAKLLYDDMVVAGSRRESARRIALYILAREAEVKAWRLPAEPPAPDAFKARVAETARAAWIRSSHLWVQQCAINNQECTVEIHHIREAAEALERDLAAYLNGGAA